MVLYIMFYTYVTHYMSLQIIQHPNDVLHTYSNHVLGHAILEKLVLLVF